MGAHKVLTQEERDQQQIESYKNAGVYAIWQLVGYIGAVVRNPYDRTAAKKVGEIKRQIELFDIAIGKADGS